MYKNVALDTSEHGQSQLISLWRHLRQHDVELSASELIPLFHACYQFKENALMMDLARKLEKLDQELFLDQSFLLLPSLISNKQMSEVDRLLPHVFKNGHQEPELELSTILAMACLYRENPNWTAFDQILKRSEKTKKLTFKRLTGHLSAYLEVYPEQKSEWEKVCKEPFLDPPSHVDVLSGQIIGFDLLKQHSKRTLALTSFLEGEYSLSVYIFLLKYFTNQNIHAPIAGQLVEKILESFVPDADFFYSLFSVLHRCPFSYSKVKELYHRMLSFNIEPNETVYRCMMRCAAVSGSLEDAMEFWYQFHQRGIPVTVATLNTVLSAYAHAGRMDSAMNFYQTEFQKHGLFPSQRTFAVLLDGFQKASDIEGMYDCFQKVLALKIRPSLPMITAIFKLYFSALPLEAVSDNITRLQTIANKALGEHVGIDHLFYATGLVPIPKDYKVKEGDLVPDLKMLSVFFEFFLKSNRLEKAMIIVETMKKNNMDIDQFVYTSMINYHLSVGDLEATFETLQRMLDKDIYMDIAVFDTMMKAYNKLSKPEQALAIFCKMLDKKIQPDARIFRQLEITLFLLLDSNVQGDNLKNKSELYNRMTSYLIDHGHVEPGYCALTHMIKCEMEISSQVFSKMLMALLEKKDVRVVIVLKYMTECDVLPDQETQLKLINLLLEAREIRGFFLMLKLLSSMGEVAKEGLIQDLLNLLKADQSAVKRSRPRSFFEFARQTLSVRNVDCEILDVNMPITLDPDAKIVQLWFLCMSSPQLREAAGPHFTLDTIQALKDSESDPRLARMIWWHLVKHEHSSLNPSIFEAYLSLPVNNVNKRSMIHAAVMDLNDLKLWNQEYEAILDQFLSVQSIQQTAV